MICFKTPKGLNEEELKAVFADIKKNSQEDKIIQAMLKARETELKLQNVEDSCDTDAQVESKPDEVNLN